MQAKRSLLCRYLNIGGTSLAPNWVLIGKGFSENTTSYNPNSDDIQYINEDTKRTSLRSYAPTMSLSGVIEIEGSNYPRTLDPVFEYLNEMRRKRTIDNTGEILEVELYTCEEYDQANSKFLRCKSSRNKVNFQFDEFGGEAGETISFTATINYDGEPTHLNDKYDVKDDSTRAVTASSASDWVYITYSMNNVSKKIGEIQTKKNDDLLTQFKANAGYTLPTSSGVTVKVGNTTQTISTDYTWDSTSGILYIKPNKITDNVTITIEGTE